MTDPIKSFQKAYIHIVQHLIEECLLLNMDEEGCRVNLLKYANISPIVTSAVWKGLVQENKEFFEEYERRRIEVPDEKETALKIKEALSKTSK